MMDHWLWFLLLGVLIGWLIEYFLLDWPFWRRNERRMAQTLEAVQGQVRTQTDELVVLRQQLASADEGQRRALRESEEMATQLGVANNATVGKERELRLLRAHVAEQEAALGQARARNQELQVQLEGAQVAVARVERQATDLQKQLLAQSQQFDDARERILALEAALQESALENDGLRLRLNPELLDGEAT